MVLKREREADTAVASPSNKRFRIDTDLANLWEKLSDDNVDTRLTTAYELILNHCRSNDLENARHIAKRLFRGLCSGRKHARLGFYVAAVAALSNKPYAFGSEAMTVPEILAILRAQTIPESGTSGQDERDHYFGRMLGVKALIDSELLITLAEFPAAEWDQILDTIYDLMSQKPWLRTEASSIVCSAIRLISSRKDMNIDKPVLKALKQLKKYKLTRTVDGLAIWLTAQEYLSNAKLPQDSWSFGDPLHPADIETLKKVLLNIQAPNSLDEDAAGNTVWSTKLHPAWTLIWKRMNQPSTNTAISLAEFWQNIVDNGLFSLSSTPERKLTGFLAFETALTTLASQDINVCFSQNLMACMIYALRASNDNYLHHVAMKVFTNVRSFSHDDRSDRVDQIIKGLLVGSDFADFDVLTKTNILQSLFESGEIDYSQGILKEMLTWLRQLPTTEYNPANVATRRKNILNVLQRAVHQSLRSAGGFDQKDAKKASVRLKAASQIIQELLKLKEKSKKAEVLNAPYDEHAYEFLREKIYSMLETLLAVGPEGRQNFFKIVRSLNTFKIEADDEIIESIATSWRLLEKCLKKFAKQTKANESGEISPVSRQLHLIEGASLLLSLILFQVFDGDEGSTEMLEEINVMVSDLLDGKNEAKIADHLVEIVLALLSQPSKFLRRAGGFVFEAFSPLMSSKGLEALREVLITNENQGGQQELFENDDIEIKDESDAQSGSENESMDSDVEVINDANADALDKNTSSSEDDSGESVTDSDGESAESEEQVAEEDNTEINDLESALAAALSTRKLNAEDLEHGFGDSDSDTDSDMSDSQMMELDEKLAEVFRSRQTQASAQKIRKEEMKSAKENVVNLKNRALDLVDIFLRSQQSRGLECILLSESLLKLARTTNTPQLTHRALELVKNHMQKSKGAKLPMTKRDAETRANLEARLHALHSIVAAQGVSNAVIEIAGQQNILICKLLIRAGGEDVESKVKQIASEEGSNSDVKRKALQEFWQRYDAWASTLQTNIEGKAKQQVSDGGNSKIPKQLVSTKSQGHKKTKKEVK